jgi:hypothetical protein
VPQRSLCKNAKNEWGYKEKQTLERSRTPESPQKKSNQNMTHYKSV